MSGSAGPQGETERVGTGKQGHGRELKLIHRLGPSGPFSGVEPSLGWGGGSGEPCPDLFQASHTVQFGSLGEGRQRGKKSENPPPHLRPDTESEKLIR